MRWQCTFVNSKGIRCENVALQRIHFASEHPFDHIDACAEHLEEYQRYCWVEDLHDKNGQEIVQ